MTTEQQTKRKDKHVLKSSHGKFSSVAELEIHRVKVSKPVRQIFREHIVSQNNWLTQDR